MLYVIVGILILIISFVVALLSLVWEQRKVEERTEELDEAGTAISVEPTDDLIADSPESVAETLGDGVVPPDVVSGHVMSTAETGGVLSIADEDVWWNKISSRGQAEEAKLGDSDEEKSINAIREELAKITANKVGDQIDEPDDATAVQVEPSRMDAKKRNLLAGEFSLGDIRKKD